MWLRLISWLLIFTCCWLNAMVLSFWWKNCRFWILPKIIYWDVPLMMSVYSGLVICLMMLPEDCLQLGPVRNMDLQPVWLQKLLKPDYCFMQLLLCLMVIQNTIVTSLIRMVVRWCLFLMMKISGKRLLMPHLRLLIWLSPTDIVYMRWEKGTWAVIPNLKI